MNLLIIHVDKFNYKPKIEAPKTDISYNNKSIRRTIYYNSLVVWITIDKNDNIEKLKKCEIELIKISKNLKCKTIVLMPVSHLIPQPKDSKTALEWILLLRKRIEQNDSIECFMEPFGYTGNWQLSSKGHSKSVLGRWV